MVAGGVVTVSNEGGLVAWSGEEVVEEGGAGARHSGEEARVWGHGADRQLPTQVRPPRHLVTGVLRCKGGISL